jgi:cell division protein FtsA
MSLGVPQGAKPVAAERRDRREGLRAALTRPGAVAAVDLGAAKVACFIMKPDGAKAAERTISVAGVGYVQSRGVKAGDVVEVDKAAEAIAKAVERAEAMAGVNVTGVTVATAGGRLECRRLAADAALGAKPIADADLSRAIATAVAPLKMPGRRVIHLRPIEWSVDGRGGVKDPRGMFGRRLGLRLALVSIDGHAFQTLAHCVERAHLEFDGVVAAPFASALATLEEDEMELGSALVDMGAGSTSLAVFSGGSLVHVDSVPVGGALVTQDVARGLSTSLAGAERIKTLHGSAIASTNEDREMIEAPPRGDDPAAGPIVAPRSLLKGIIAPRVEETFELVRDRLKDVPLDPGAGVVLTGGASQLAGVRELAVRVFDRPVRLGRPRRAPHLADAAAGPAFCAAVGVLHRAAYGPREAGVRRAARAGQEGGAFARAAAWLRENL